nr:Wzy polymerase domain-containing protein [uncultured Variovorax sp.]
MAFSPEPRVVLKLIDSARLLGREAEVREHVERLRQVYPEAYLKWLAGRPPT